MTDPTRTQKGGRPHGEGARHLRPRQLSASSWPSREGGVKGRIRAAIVTETQYLSACSMYTGCSGVARAPQVLVL